MTLFSIAQGILFLFLFAAFCFGTYIIFSGWGDSDLIGLEETADDFYEFYGEHTEADDEDFDASHRRL